MKEVTKPLAIGTLAVVVGVGLIVFAIGSKSYLAQARVVAASFGAFIVFFAIWSMSVQFRHLRKVWESALQETLTSIFMRMTRSNSIPFGDRRRILEEFADVDRRLSIRVESGAVNEDGLTTNFLEYLAEATGSDRQSVHLVGAKYSQRRESQIGADLALILVVRSTDGVHARWCIVQAKRFDMASLGYLEIDRKRHHTDKQIRLMEKYHPVSHYVFYNPPDLDVDEEKRVFGTRFMATSLVGYYRGVADGKLAPETVLSNGVSLPEFFTNFPVYSLRGAPPKEIQDSAGRILALAIDLPGTGKAIDLSPYFSDQAEFVFAPAYERVFEYEGIGVRAGMVPAKEKLEIAERERAQAERERAYARERERAYARQKERADADKVLA